MGEKLEKENWQTDGGKDAVSHIEPIVYYEN